MSQARFSALSGSATRPAHWVALAVLTLAGAVLRLYHLGHKSLWFDEANTWQVIQGSIDQVLAANAATNSAPPLYPVLLSLLTGADASEAMLRAPAALAGIAAIPLVFLLARQWLDPWFALVAAGLAALSPTLVQYSQELREYALSFALSAGLIASLARFASRPTTGSAVAIALLGTLGICTQYGIGILLAGLNLVLLPVLWRNPARGRALGLWLGSQIPAGIAALALLLTTVREQSLWMPRVLAGYLSGAVWDGSADGAYALLVLGAGHLINFAYPGWLFVALVGVGLLTASLRPEWRRLVLFLTVPIALVMVAALARRYPFGGIRQLIVFLPLIYVVAAAGIAAIVGWLGAARLVPWAGSGVAATAALVLAYQGTGASVAWLRSTGTEPVRDMVAILRDRLGPGDQVYVYSGAVPAFRYYWRNDLAPWIAGSDHWSGLDPAIAARQMPIVQREIAALAARREPLWMLVTHIKPTDMAWLMYPLQRRFVVEPVASAPGIWLIRIR